MYGGLILCSLHSGLCDGRESVYMCMYVQNYCNKNLIRDVKNLLF